MIEQMRELWPPDGDRERRWGAAIIGAPGAAETVVIVRHYAVLSPGEELTEYPPTVEMTWAEWEQHCADYGLTVEGAPV